MCFERFLRFWLVSVIALGILTGVHAWHSASAFEPSLITYSLQDSLRVCLEGAYFMVLGCYMGLPPRLDCLFL